MSTVHVFVGCSLDGFIAGPNDELDWLQGDPGEAPPDNFAPFMERIGALLMGRRTYDVLCGFEQWPYGDTPLLVATTRAITPKHPSVRAVQGSIEAMITEAKQAAGERGVYIDGGRLIRSAMDAGLVDEITTTVVPMVLGAGVPLFAGLTHRRRLDLLSQRKLGSAAVELRYRVRKG